MMLMLMLRLMMVMMMRAMSMSYEGDEQRVARQQTGRSKTTPLIYHSTLSILKGDLNLFWNFYLIYHLER